MGKGMHDLMLPNGASPKCLRIVEGKNEPLNVPKNGILFERPGNLSNTTKPLHVMFLSLVLSHRSWTNGPRVASKRRPLTGCYVVLAISFLGRHLAIGMTVSHQQTTTPSDGPAVQPIMSCYYWNNCIIARKEETTCTSWLRCVMVESLGLG